MPSAYQNSKWPFIHWSWDEIHLPVDTHNDRETLNAFLRWLASKVSGLSNQIPVNKNQLQELLLGIALYLRDLEYSCFVDSSEITVPDYINNSYMEPTDAQSIARIVESFFKAVQNQLE